MDVAINTVRPSLNHYSKELSPLQKKCMMTEADETAPPELREASRRLFEDLENMGSGAYHHHYHNAIVGNKDADFRYNKKWSPRRFGQRGGSFSNHLGREIGAVKTGDFRRGQGGLFHNVEVPVDVEHAAQLYLDSELKKTMADIGFNEPWQATKRYTRYQRAKNLVETDEIKEAKLKAAIQ